jgi:hypothetical protein
MESSHKKRSWSEHRLFTCEQFHPKQTHFDFVERGTPAVADERRFFIRLQEAREAAERGSWLNAIQLCDEDLLPFKPFDDPAFNLLTDAIKAQHGRSVRAWYNRELIREGTDGNWFVTLGLALVSLILVTWWFVGPVSSASLDTFAANVIGLVGLAFGMNAHRSRPITYTRSPHWIWSRFPDWEFDPALDLETFPRNDY